MKLIELAGEYRLSGDACRSRVSALKRELSGLAGSETQRIGLRRRITLLSQMARETSAIAKYLENYYIRREGEND